MVLITKELLGKNVSNEAPILTLFPRVLNLKVYFKMEN